MRHRSAVTVIRLLLGLCALCGATQPAHALLCGTGLDPIGVSVTPVNFGSYTPTSPLALTANGTIKISCGLGLDLLPDFAVALSQGGGGGFLPRRMANGTAHLAYNLYATPALLDIWGDGLAGTVTETFSSLLHLGSVNFTVYGRVPAGQFVPSGTYSDTITVTVTY